MAEIVPTPHLDLLPPSEVPPISPSGGSDRPVITAPAVEEGGTRPEVAEAADLAAADKEKVIEQAKDKADETPEDKQAKDDTPPHEKAYITKEKNRRKAIEEQLRQTQEQLRQTLELAQRYIPRPEAQPEPRRENFADDDAYVEARADWKAEQKVAARMTQEKAKVEQAEQNKLRQTYVERLSEAEERLPGIKDVAVDPTLPVSSAMGEAIVTSDAAPDILHYLDENREEAARIATLSPARAAAEIGKIEAKLAAPKEVKVSKAPKPISPINGGGGMPKNKYDPGVTDEQYFAMVDKERAEKVAALRK